MLVLFIITLILVAWSRWLAHCGTCTVCMIFAVTALANVVVQNYAPGLSGLAYSLLGSVIVVLSTKGN